MKTLSSIEIYFLSKELIILEGSKINKIYNLGDKELVFSLHSPQLGKPLFKFIDNSIPYLDSNKEIYDSPSDFCFKLRKYLEGYSIQKIKQVSSERIIEISLSTKHDKRYLILEIFSKGNLILCDEDYSVILASHYHKWKDREIKPKSKYEFPKSRVNFFNLNKKEFEETLNNSKKDSIVTALALDMGFGGLISEELCYNSEIEKTRMPKEIEKEELLKLYVDFKKIISLPVKPAVIFKDAKIVDVVPFQLNVYKDFEIKEFITFSEALSYYIGNSSLLAKKDTKTEQEMSKLQEIIKKQEEKIKEMEISEKDLRSTGEKIYENYQPIITILNEVKSMLKEKNFQEIKKTLKHNKIIEDIDPMEKAIVIDI